MNVKETKSKKTNKCGLKQEKHKLAVKSEKGRTHYPAPSSVSQLKRVIELEKPSGLWMPLYLHASKAVGASEIDRISDTTVLRITHQ